MLEVAPPVALGLWDKPWAWSADNALAGCMPLSQPYQGGPCLNLQSFWNSLAPRTRNERLFRGSMQSRPSIELSVQPTVPWPKKRRRSAAPRSEGTRRTDAPTQQPLSHLNHDECPQPLAATKQMAPLPKSGLRICTTAFPDTLLSSIACQPGRPYEPKNLCDLCRQPFEVEDDALHRHLSRHLRELETVFPCNTCQVSFSHTDDLRWHNHSSDHRDGMNEPSRNALCDRLRHWEQAQLHLHSQTIDQLLQSRSNRPPSRSSSLPPRKRKPLDTITDDRHMIDDKHVTDDEDSDAVDIPYIRVTKGTELNSTDLGTSHSTLCSLQQRIRDLMQQFQPNTPNEQATPYSEFCDSHSLPGSPEQFSKDSPETKADRAVSEPPLRLSTTGDGTKQAAAYHAHGHGYSTSGAVWNSTSPKQGQKRSSDGRDLAQWQEDDGGGNGGLQPKKRKTGNGSNLETEKRFPCIYNIGEPIEFKNDLARHRHISNMCRHLKSHNFYCCSTCITRMRTNEELERHIGQHVKACGRRGCKRTRPAGHHANPINCDHIMSGEDQWREMFVLQFNRQPPNIFGTTTRAQSHVTDTVQPTGEREVSNDPLMQYSLESSEDCLVDYGLTESFFEQAMDFDLGLPPNNIQSDSAPLDMDEFLVPDSARGLQVTEQTKAGAETRSDEETITANESEQPNAPIQDVAAGLQQQLAALEKMISTQTCKDKDRLFTLQEKVVQLEQKLFQSSERERQLEATLEVIFEALQASGAPSAQPNKPLWNLVKSHSSQIIGSVTTTMSRPSRNDQETVSSNSFMSMSPSLTFATEPKLSARTPPDSAYGSVR